MSDLAHSVEKSRRLEEEVRTSLVNGYLPCAVAFQVAKRIKVAPKAVGNVANKVGIRIINCQLGCFGMEKAVPSELNSESISEAVAEGVKNSLANGRLLCATAFKLGKELTASLDEIGDAANKLRIKIANCQLGCFA